MGKINVLIVDQAPESGESIMSIVNLVLSIDRQRFKVVLLRATGDDLLRNKRDLGFAIDVVTARKTLQENPARTDGSSPGPPYRRVLGESSAFLFRVARFLVNIPYMFKVAGVIRSHDIQVVHLNNGVDDETATVCRLLKVRQVAYVREHVPFSPLQCRLFLPAVNHFITVSKYVRDAILRDGIDVERVSVATPPAIRERVAGDRVAELRARYNLRAGETVVGIFGALAESTGQLQFLQAAERVLRRTGAVRLFVVGGAGAGGNYSKRLLDLVRDAGMEEKVEFTGLVEKFYDYYELMDLVVHCSLVPESSGRVIFEAMSQGKPVIASPFGSTREFVDHGVDGYLVDPMDIDQLARRMIELIENPGMARQMGAVASIKMEHLYNRSAYARIIESCYERCFPGSSARVALES